MKANSKSIAMETKNLGSEEKSASQASTGKGKEFVNFGHEIKQELKKIEWTTKEELRAYTKMVVISTFVFGIGVYFTDLLVQSFLSGVHHFFKFLIG